MRAGTKDTKPCLGDTMDDLYGKKARWEASGNTEEEEAMINPPGCYRRGNFGYVAQKAKVFWGSECPGGLSVQGPGSLTALG